ncbi:hypothetical protein NA57DRAFT_81010 [Rhizodiscina lignyota]|uniref:Uncharacterized protein n=1 Tax=Rhizodiscina lignyota TaxID=1504668 RepID=A0A9P4I8J1_9PEZI|nr:hypothetical protein NA57DRAFT_81010 [Rhizodiscina lignyota]
MTGPKMKWTADADRLLLISMIGALNIPVTENAQKIANFYPPNDNGEKPTAKAITERVYRIKKQFQKHGTAEPRRGARANNTYVRVASSTATTPRRARAPRQPKTPKTPPSSSKKRKAAAADSDDDDEYAPNAKSKGKGSNLSKEAAALMKDNPAFAFSGRASTPSKKRAKKEVDYAEDMRKENEDESENLSSDEEQIQVDEGVYEDDFGEVMETNTVQPIAFTQASGTNKNNHGMHPPMINTQLANSSFGANFAGSHPAASFPVNQNGFTTPVSMPSSMGAHDNYYGMPHTPYMGHGSSFQYNPTSYSMPTTPAHGNMNMSSFMTDNSGDGDFSRGNFDGHNSTTASPTDYSNALYGSPDDVFGPALTRPRFGTNFSMGGTPYDSILKTPPKPSTVRSNTLYQGDSYPMTPHASPYTTSFGTQGSQETLMSSLSPEDDFNMTFSTDEMDLKRTFPTNQMDVQYNDSRGRLESPSPGKDILNDGYSASNSTGILSPAYSHWQLLNWQPLILQPPNWQPLNWRPFNWHTRASSTMLTFTKDSVDCPQKLTLQRCDIPAFLLSNHTTTTGTFLCNYTWARLS